MPGMNCMKRGALIVLEGCDKAGKSTHSRLLTDALNKGGRTAHLINFPDRTTEIGKMIDAYMRCQTELRDETIHLLFSANRWEMVPKIQQLLLNGESVILDRYAFSGVAYSAAKGNLSLEWCMSPDVGLPQPDQVIFLNLSENDAAGREDYGKERYEQTDFQKKVKDVYLQLKDKDDSYWTVVDSNREKEEVHKDILELAGGAIQRNELEPILPLWKNIFDAAVQKPMTSSEAGSPKKTGKPAPIHTAV